MQLGWPSEAGLGFVDATWSYWCYSKREILKCRAEKLPEAPGPTWACWCYLELLVLLKTGNPEIQGVAMLPEAPDATWACWCYRELLVLLKTGTPGIQGQLLHRSKNALAQALFWEYIYI